MEKKTMMSKTAANIFALFILFFPTYALAGLGELRLSRLEGDVQIRTVDTDEWSPAVINFPLNDGDQLWVPQYGRAEVESRRGTIIRLDERTSFDILTVDRDALQFYLEMGQAYVNVKGGRDTTLQMDTPRSSIRVYDRAKFNADVPTDDDTDISVFEGAITAENRHGEILVEPGKILSLENDSSYLYPLTSVSEWERWNKDQDRTIERRRGSSRYLPEGLAGYSSDFDNNGEWVDLPSYGHVWRPTIQNRADWSPYRDGRWVWIGDDYVWIARESWGWAPYHYGRWSFVFEYGWCWVPPPRDEVHWGPGYVGWVHTPTYTAWVPLAPEEVYYGRGNYGPHSVNILHIDINKVVINNTYKNAHVRNSVTTVHNDSFIRGKRVDFKVHENPFLQEKISVGRPQIKPERASRIASTREIPKASRPPERVRETKVEVLKQQRRLVKKRGRSVFLPETAPQKMRAEDKKEPRSKSLRKEKLQEEETQKNALQRRDEAQSTQGERRSPAPAAAPPPESRRESRQSPHSRAEEKPPSRDAGGGQTKNPWSTQANHPREEARPTPAGRKLPLPAPAAATPPESSRETKQSQSFRKEEKQLDRTKGEAQTENRRSPQVKTLNKEGKPIPAETKDEVKDEDEDEGDSSQPGHKKKVKKEKPFEQGVDFYEKSRE